MKLNLSLVLIVVCVLTAQAQKVANKDKASDEKAKIAAQQLILKKQIVADDIDRQAKDVPFADVRIFVRTSLARWLWKDGKDETGRAEPLAVKAFEELYEKIDEIVEPHSLKANLFALLEVNAKETARRLEAKYNVGTEEGLLDASMFLSQKNNDKIVADKIKKALLSEKDLNRIQIYISMLRLKKSPEFVSVLSEIVRLSESGMRSFSAASLIGIADNFNDSTVPNDLKIRFYKIVLNKSVNTLQSTDSGEAHFTDLLLFRVLPEMKTNAPALAEQAIAVKLALAVKVPQGTKDLQELEQRISESTDKIATLIAEADKTDNKNLKNALLFWASRLALEQDKFRLAADLVEKTLEEATDYKTSKDESRVSEHDGQLLRTAETAIRRNDFDSADYAAEKIIEDLTKAGALLGFSGFFNSKKDSATALAMYDEALRLTVKADNSKSKYSMLFRLINAANFTDRNRLPEITSITAETINKIPTLNVEDKPDTAKFKEYVSTISRINMHLYITVGNLTRTSRNAATSFTNEINRRELRIVADLALATVMFEPEKKQPNAK